MTTRPRTFIGSSVEGLPIAEAIQVNLDHECEVVIWSQGIFGLGGGTLESLVESIGTFDFAILVLTPDDMILSRDLELLGPRDNVVLELGLCIGALGRNRSFVVYDRSKTLKFPTDMAGVTMAPFHPHRSGDLRPALGAPCTLIKEAIRNLGRRGRDSEIQIRGGSFHDVRGLEGFTFEVKNTGSTPIPPYDLALFNPNGGTMFMFHSEVKGELLPDQIREHRCAAFKRGSPMFKGMFRQEDDIDLTLTSFRLVLEHSDKVLYENKRLGRDFSVIFKKAVSQGLGSITGEDAWKLHSHPGDE